MGLVNDPENHVTLAIDSDLLNEEFICCHPCVSTSTLKIRTDDMLNIFLPYTGHSFKIIHA